MTQRTTMWNTLISRTAPVWGVTAFVFLVGCSGFERQPFRESDTDSPVIETNIMHDHLYSGFLTATIFIEGNNRFPFRIIDIEGRELRDAEVVVTFSLLDQGAEVIPFSKPAKWHESVISEKHVHSDGQVHKHQKITGLYVVDDLGLRETGIWYADLSVTFAGETFGAQGLGFNVIGDSNIPMPGDLVPASDNLTMDDVKSFSEISSRGSNDALHDHSVAQAMQLGHPFVVLFSSPMFCLSRICAPMTDVVEDIQGLYGDQVHFIHIEAWDLEVARNEGRLVPAQEMLDWHIETEPWIFIVSRNGELSARFEGFTSKEEVIHEIENTLTAN